MQEGAQQQGCSRGRAGRVQVEGIHAGGVLERGGAMTETGAQSREYGLGNLPLPRDVIERQSGRMRSQSFD